MRKYLYALSVAAFIAVLSFTLGACSPAAPGGPKASSTADAPKSSSVADGPKASSTAPYLSNTSFSPQTEQAINDFIAAYGKDAPAYQQNAYVVSDFDDTTSISDITYQCGTYQLQTMSFALDPDGLRAAISTYVDLNADDNAAWVDDIDAAYRQLYKTYGPFSAAGLDQAAQAKLQQDPQWAEFATKLQLFSLHVEDTLDYDAGCKWTLNLFSGMTEAEVYDLFKRSCETYADKETEIVTWTSPEGIESKIGVVSCDIVLGVSVTDDVRAMLEAYDANGIDVWICSGSHADGVRAAVDAFGLGDYVDGVIGMTQKLEGGVYVPAYDYETGYAWVNKGGAWEKSEHAIRTLSVREGKVVAIENVLVPRYGTGPIAGFMDSGGDFNFCTEFDSMKMVICYNLTRKITDGAGLVAVVAVYQQDDLHYDFASADAAGDTLYLLQGRDENGKRDLRPSNKTVHFGETQEQLFANEDNEKLLQYLEENRLTTKEAFDRFAVNRDADDPNNVLKLDYGYLDDYDGYHSHDGIPDEGLAQAA